MPMFNDHYEYNVDKHNKKNTYRKSEAKLSNIPEFKMRSDYS